MCRARARLDILEIHSDELEISLDLQHDPRQPLADRYYSNQRLGGPISQESGKSQAPFAVQVPRVSRSEELIHSSVVSAVERGLERLNGRFSV